MSVYISINGKDIVEYGLSALDGTINALMKPADFRSLSLNENSSFDGSLADTTPSKRHVAKQDLSIPFLMRCNSFADSVRLINSLIDDLKNGAMENGAYTGVNELYVPELECKYRLVYTSMSKYNCFGSNGSALVTLKFTELNPNNRGL